MTPPDSPLATTVLSLFQVTWEVISALEGGEVLKVPVAMNLAVLPALIVAGFVASAEIVIVCSVAAVTFKVAVAVCEPRVAVMVEVAAEFPADARPLLTLLSIVAPVVLLQATELVISTWAPLE